MLNLSKSAHENIIYVAVALFAFLGQPALVRAEVNYNPVNFTEPLNLSRGSLTATSPGGIYLSHEDTCNLLVEESGWERESCGSVENLVVGTPAGVDSYIVYKPNNDGFVVFDDWDADTDEEIAAIWDSYAEGLKAQGERLGIEVKPVRWYVYPTLNQEEAMMYYAIMTEWDGVPNINVNATLFDRRGYVTFGMVLASADPGEAVATALMLDTLSSYQPTQEESYFDFSEGDKIAAVGAMGVLATLMGVKYGKGFFAAALGILLLVVKKAWFILLLPLIFVKRLFKGKSSG